MPTVLYSADVVCPMTGPPLAQGGVLVAEDRVVAVGESSPLRRHAEREHHVDGVLLPGLVNAHTHLEMTRAALLARPGPHHAWAGAQRGVTLRWSDDDWQRSAREGVLAATRAGTTCVGDVVRRGSGVPAASRAGMVGDSWIEIDLVDTSGQDAVIAALDHSLGLPAGERRVGIAPSAPWALGTGVLQALVALGERRGAPLQVHAAASQAEVRALWYGDGPLVDLVRSHGLDFEWLEEGTELAPVRYLAQLGVLRPGTSLVHGIWVDDREAQLLAEQRVTVVCCPRSAALLDMGEPPLQRYARAGTPLAIGTESLAAAGDLDPLAEAAAWADLASRQELVFWPSPAGPVELAEQAVRLVTVDGAAAMGWGDRAGVIAPGRRADLVGVQVPTTPATVYSDLVAKGAGRQVLTVLGGVRRSRRADADTPWPAPTRADGEPDGGAPGTPTS
jgi:aminodeoxyfutalosine deaminase